jgi:hypothetical protein
MPPALFLKIHLDIILPSMPRSSKWTLSLQFPHQNPVYTSPLPLHDTCFTHIIHYLITQIVLGEQYRSLSYVLCSFVHSPVHSSLLGPNMFISTLFSNSLMPTFLPQCEWPSFTTIQNNR